MFSKNKKQKIICYIFVIFSSDMVEILDKDRTDEEALSYALDTLSNICSPEEFEEEIVDSRPVQDMSRPRCEIFVFFSPLVPSKREKNIFFACFEGTREEKNKYVIICVH